VCLLGSYILDWTGGGGGVTLAFVNLFTWGVETSILTVRVCDSFAVAIWYHPRMVTWVTSHDQKQSMPVLIFLWLSASTFWVRSWCRLSSDWNNRTYGGSTQGAGKKTNVSNPKVASIMAMANGSGHTSSSSSWLGTMHVKGVQLADHVDIALLLLDIVPFW
jgi:hypothetical protein